MTKLTRVERERPLEGRAELLYMVLAGVFLGALVVTNLIANKFLTLDAGFKVFILSAGALPYPVTFLATDLMSEIYGHRRANQVVWVGLIVSLFVLLALWLGSLFPAIPESPVSDDVYMKAFRNAWRVIAASMTAYLIAQLVDVKLFHFWKRFTRGKHLWLRNNGSTILSQLVDSVLVVLVLFWGAQSGEWMMSTILDLWLFKAIIALCDTPFFYAGTWALRRWTGWYDEADAES
ncbi:MAG: queuosine precursor transporter [Acidobacteria bacterium]|nr:queuosine precursor transporter [Acidobacteriota bacterium]